MWRAQTYNADSCNKPIIPLVSRIIGHTRIYCPESVHPIPYIHTPFRWDIPVVLTGSQGSINANTTINICIAKTSYVETPLSNTNINSCVRLHLSILVNIRTYIHALHGSISVS